MTEKKKRVSIETRKKRAAYYIQNRGETCPHCEDLPMLIASHDALALKNRHFKKEIKDLKEKLEKFEKQALLEEFLNSHGQGFIGRGYRSMSRAPFVPWRAF